MFTLNCKGKLLVLDRPLVMGIINCTPDSFYAGSRFTVTDEVLRQAEKMLGDGADIIDIGGQSSRPGSQPVDAEEELKRVVPAIRAVIKKFPEAIISIDTWFAKVAAEAVAAGASMVNDISAGTMDQALIPAVASMNVPYILMHMQGTPQFMQLNPQYENVTREVLDFFVGRLQQLKTAGIHDVILDPGFGFGKTISQNFELLKNLSVFKMLEKPILIGVSRKSMVYQSLAVTADDALNGTTVLNTLGLMNGASLLRVHDVKEAKQAITLLETVYKK